MAAPAHNLRAELLDGWVQHRVVDLHVTLRQAIWIFFTFSVLYIALTRGHFIGTDEIGNYQMTRSLYERGSLSIGPILNTFRGRWGRTYSQYSPGQSVAAIPLYMLGKGTGKLLENTGKDRAAAALAGPSIGFEPTRWGGDIEIFFVNLFNCFMTAALCAVFFVFSVALGVEKNWAVVSTLLLGLTSYVAPFSTGFLQHSSEAFFVLTAFYFLFRDSQREDWRFRVAAGVAGGLMVLFRQQSAVALPALSIYLAGIVWRRKGSIVRECSAFILPAVAGILLHMAVNYLKFETVLGKYNNEGFHTPVLKGLYAFLLSPGDSVFIYTPLLLLAPFALRFFMRRYRAEGLLILGLAMTYFIFYGKYTFWHGLWSWLGPRYMAPIVPLLLLPLGLWMEHVGRRVWIVVAPLAALGFWVQMITVAVSFPRVFSLEGWLDDRPTMDFLFIPRKAPVLAFSRAFLSGDRRVDMWLVNVYRDYGVGELFLFLFPLIALLLFCVSRLAVSLREAK